MQTPTKTKSSQELCTPPRNQRQADEGYVTPPCRPNPQVPNAPQRPKPKVSNVDQSEWISARPAGANRIGVMRILWPKWNE